MNKKYSAEEIQFIKDNASKYSDEDLTKELMSVFNRFFTMGAVRKQRQRLGISKKGHRGHFEMVDNTKKVEQSPPKDSPPTLI